MISVMVRIDSAGESPVLIREETQLLSIDGAKWRWVADTEDEEEALAIVDYLEWERRRASPFQRRSSLDHPGASPHTAGARV